MIHSRVDVQKFENSLCTYLLSIFVSLTFWLKPKIVSDFLFSHPPHTYVHGILDICCDISAPRWVILSCGGMPRHAGHGILTLGVMSVSAP
jgi:hypothetical protein